MGMSFSGATFKGEVEIETGSDIPTRPSSNAITSVKTETTLLTVPAGKKWIIVFCSAQLINTGTVYIRIDDAGGTLRECCTSSVADVTYTLTGNPVAVLTAGQEIAHHHSTAGNGTSIITYYEVNA